MWQINSCTREACGVRKFDPAGNRELLQAIDKIGSNLSGKEPGSAPVDPTHAGST
jgi:hypothetical protein